MPASRVLTINKECSKAPLEPKNPCRPTENEIYNKYVFRPSRLRSAPIDVRHPPGLLQFHQRNRKPMKTTVERVGGASGNLEPGSRRQDMLDALSGVISRRLPTWELEFHLWQKFTGERYLVGTPFAALTPSEQAAQLETNARVMVEVATELGFSGITLPPWYWESAPGEPSYSWLPEPARESLLRMLLDMAGDRFFFVVHVGGVLAMPPAHCYEDFCCKIFDEPEEIDRLARERCDEGKRQVARWAALGADGYLMPSDLAMNSGPFYRPEQMDRFIHPFLREMTEAIRAAGWRSILHTDGNIMSLLRGFADCGVDAIQALDPIAGMDLRLAKQEVGDRITLCGNVDCCTLLAGTPEQVKAETRLCMEKGNLGGRFVLGVSNVVEPSAPKENFQAMIEAWREAEGVGRAK